MRLRYGSRGSSLKSNRKTKNNTKISTPTSRKKKESFSREKAKEKFFSPLHNDLSKSRAGRNNRRGKKTK